MSNPSVITLRVSAELKNRLSALAKQEGVSMNQLVTYFLTEKITAMEMSESLKKRLERIESKSKDDLRSAAVAAFARIKARQAQRDKPIDVPEWDRWPSHREELPEELLSEQVLMKFAKAAKLDGSVYQSPSRPSHAVHEPKPEYDADKSD